MPDCALPRDALPAACDPQAASLAGHGGQGYVSVGRASQELLLRLPDRDLFRMGPRWPQCALVADEAAALSTPGAAALVDAAGAVLRCGLPSPGAEAGRRTTVRVLGPADVELLVDRTRPPPREAVNALDRARDGQMGSAFNKPGLLRHATLLVAQSEAALNASLEWQQAHPSADAVLVDPDFAQHVLDAHGGSQPSAAFYALALAAERCERVLLFGFACEAGGAAGSSAAAREEERLARALLAKHAEVFAFAPKE